MKKIIALCLALTCLVGLIGCGEKNRESKSATIREEQKPALTVAEKAEDGRTILKFAITNILPPKLQERVETFNSTNKEYVVKLVDYTTSKEKGTSFEASLLKLRTDIVSGSAPDIIDLNGLSMQTLTNKGLLEELNPYIEKDPNLGSGSLVEGAYKSLKDETGLHRIAPFFFVSGLYGKKSLVGDKQSWTFDEMVKFLDKNSSVKTPFVNMRMNQLIIQTVNQFVKKDGTCNFDSPEFIELLKLMKKYGNKEPVYEGAMNSGRAIASGKYLLSLTYLSGVDDYAVLNGDMNGDLNMIGLPTQSGHGNMADFATTFGMLASSPSKDGCWQFLSSLLDESYQKGSIEFKDDAAIEGSLKEIPILKKAFDESVTKSNAPQDVKSEFVKVVDQLQSATSTESGVLQIIIDQLPKLYDGSNDPQKTAKIIQDKATIFLSENK